MTDTDTGKRIVVQRGLWFEEFETGVLYQHRPGRTITEALASDAGWRVLVLGLVITAAGALVLVVGLHVLRHLTWLETAGGLAGAQTQPAILAYVNDRTGYDTRVGVAYALVYPVAMIVKIVVAQVLAGLS